MPDCKVADDLRPRFPRAATRLEEAAEDIERFRNRPSRRAVSAVIPRLPRTISFSRLTENAELPRGFDLPNSQRLQVFFEEHLPGVNHARGHRSIDMRGRGTMAVTQTVDCQFGRAYARAWLFVRLTA